MNAFIQLIYSCFSHRYVPTNSIGLLSPCKPTHNPQFFHSLWWRANAQNVSFLTCYGCQFKFQLSWYNQITFSCYPHRRSTTVSLETFTLNLFINVLVGLSGCFSTSRYNEWRWKQSCQGKNGVFHQIRCKSWSAWGHGGNPGERDKDSWGTNCMDTLPVT